MTAPEGHAGSMVGSPLVWGRGETGRGEISDPGRRLGHLGDQVTSNPVPELGQWLWANRGGGRTERHSGGRLLKSTRHITESSGWPPTPWRVFYKPPSGATKQLSVLCLSASLQACEVRTVSVPFLSTVVSLGLSTVPSSSMDENSFSQMNMWVGGHFFFPRY